MPESPRLASSEIGTLWMTYQQKTLVLMMLEYFIEKGLLPSSPYVATQKPVEHVKGTNYLGMFNIKGKRALNTVELAHLHHSIESNVTGMQMIFALLNVPSTKWRLIIFIKVEK